MPLRSGAAYISTVGVRNDLKMSLQRSLVDAMYLLAQALHWDVYVPQVWG